MEINVRNCRSILYTDVESYPFMTNEGRNRQI